MAVSRRKNIFLFFLSFFFLCVCLCVYKCSILPGSQICKFFNNGWKLFETFLVNYEDFEMPVKKSKQYLKFYWGGAQKLRTNKISLKLLSGHTKFYRPENWLKKIIRSSWKSFVKCMKIWLKNLTLMKIH